LKNQPAQITPLSLMTRARSEMQCDCDAVHLAALADGRPEIVVPESRPSGGSVHCPDEGLRTLPCLAILPTPSPHLIVVSPEVFLWRPQ
jgi:hypothetical protein